MLSISFNCKLHRNCKHLIFDQRKIEQATVLYSILAAHTLCLPQLCCSTAELNTSFCTLVLQNLAHAGYIFVCAGYIWVQKVFFPPFHAEKGCGKQRRRKGVRQSGKFTDYLLEGIPQVFIQKSDLFTKTL
jgi:hypothetical protein